MHLYLMRHGIATPPTFGQNDDARSLTDEGIHLLKRQARVFKQAGLRVDYLFHSPLVRARQTATLIAPAFGVVPQQDTLLNPGCGLDDVAELLERQALAEHVMLVGHQPDMGYLVRILTGSNAMMRTGMLAVIDTAVIRPSQGILLGLYDSRVMGRLGASG